MEMNRKCALPLMHMMKCRPPSVHKKCKPPSIHKKCMPPFQCK